MFSYIYIYIYRHTNAKTIGCEAGGGYARACARTFLDRGFLKKLRSLLSLFYLKTNQTIGYANSNRTAPSETSGCGDCCRDGPSETVGYGNYVRINIKKTDRVPRGGGRGGGGGGGGGGRGKDRRGG